MLQKYEGVTMTTWSIWRPCFVPEELVSASIRVCVFWQGVEGLPSPCTQETLEQWVNLAL